MCWIERNENIATQRVSILILVMSFCSGAFVGLLLQAGVFAAFLVFIKKERGKNPQPDESVPFLPCWNLHLLLHADVAFHADHQKVDPDPTSRRLQSPPDKSTLS